MFQINNRSIIPDKESISQYINNPLFSTFCEAIEGITNVMWKTEFSRCSLEPGWNLKCKKGGRSLCTVYPRENYFTVLVVIGQKEKTRVEAILYDLSENLYSIYEDTQEGNGQKWLMIDLEDDDDTYEDVLKLIQIRYECRP